MPYPWFKFYGGEFLSDVKTLNLDDTARSCWLTLLCYANVSPIPGKIRLIENEQLLLASGAHVDDAERLSRNILSLFSELEMIRIEENYIYIINWEKRQESYLTDAERASRYRHARVTSPSGKVTLDKDIDKEGDIDKDINTSSSSDDDVYASSPGFDKFWEAYPKKKGKGQALKTWKKLKPSKKLQEKILASVAEHIANDRQWSKEDGQFIPHPSTWLNARRFDDEVQVTAGRKVDTF